MRSANYLVLGIVMAVVGVLLTALLQPGLSGLIE